MDHLHVLPVLLGVVKTDYRITLRTLKLKSDPRTGTIEVPVACPPSLVLSNDSLEVFVVTIKFLCFLILLLVSLSLLLSTSTRQTGFALFQFVLVCRRRGSFRFLLLFNFRVEIGLLNLSLKPDDSLV